MAELDDHTVEELQGHSETLVLEDFVRIVETNHPDGQGIDRDTIAEYAEALDYDVDAFDEEIDDRLTDADSWTEGEVFYRLDEGRISVFPPHWHDELADISDLRKIIRVIQEDRTTAEGESQEHPRKEGVSEEMLDEVAAAIGGMDRNEVRDRLKELRDENEIEEYPSQHANPWIQLT